MPAGQSVVKTEKMKGKKNLDLEVYDNPKPRAYTDICTWTYTAFPISVQYLKTHTHM